MSNPTLSLTNIIPVTVSVSPTGPTGPTFNQGLILGTSPNTQGAALPNGSQGATRIAQYESLSAVGAAYGTTTPEYQAAEVYFGQSPAPFFLWIGQQYLNVIATATVDAGGSGYAVGDVLAVSGGVGGQVTVTSVSTGAVTGISLTSPGYGYAGTTGEATTAVTGSGTGFTVTITVGPETPVAAMTACRMICPQWYASMYVGSYTGQTIDTDLENLSAYIQACTPASVFFLTSADNAVLYNTTNNLFATLQAAKRSRTFMMYSTPQYGTAQATPTLTTTAGSVTATVSSAANVAAGQYIVATGVVPGTQVVSVVSTTVTMSIPATATESTEASGFYAQTVSGVQNVQPLNFWSSAAPMGMAMGRNSGAPGSYFDLMFKQVEQIAPEPLTQTQANTICGAVNRSTSGLNGNVLLVWANGAYEFLINATMADGSFFDQTLFLDMLASAIQYNGVTLLTSVPALPITDSGVAQMANAVSQACAQSQSIGFIANTGTWDGVTIGPISAGTKLPKGYYVYAPPVSTLTPIQRAARQLPPISVLLIEAQSGHSVAIQVNVQQ